MQKKKTYTKPKINIVNVDNRVNLTLQSSGNEGNGNGNGNAGGNGNGKPFGVSPFPDSPFNKNNLKIIKTKRFMNSNDLELRMYFFVPYQLTGMQKGIQAGHAALEYAKLFGDSKKYINFVENHKTWIILNGGTTNNSYEIGTGEPMGSLNKIADTLIENNINFSYFHEPDLNDALTAICFIADERVFNYHDYPDFDKYIEGIPLGNDDTHADVDGLYEDWLNLIGGERNKVLRELIKNKKLA